jgi:hypothetical protein
MSDYVNVAFNFVRSRPDIFSVPSETSCFRGFTFWKFDPLERKKSGGGDYPPKSGNVWSPLGPTKDELRILKTQLAGGPQEAPPADNFCVVKPGSRSFCRYAWLIALGSVVLIGGAVTSLVCRYRKKSRRRNQRLSGSDNMVEPLMGPADV